MRARPFATLASAVAAVCLAGCHSKPDNVVDGPAISYESREPGSDVVPTDEASFQLLQKEPAQRLLNLQGSVVQAGNRCSLVTKGVLVGGLDGTDEWRVTCADSGVWQLMLAPDGSSVSHCTPATCS